MRLRQLVPSLLDVCPNTGEVIKALQDASVRTTFDLLFAGSPEVLYKRLPKDLLTFGHFVRLRDRVATLSATPGETGVLALRQELAESEAEYKGSTGVKELDELVAGAFGAYGVVELSGSATSLLATWVVLRHLAVHANSSAWWLDTAGEFSASQAAAVIQALGSQDMTALERLQISVCSNLTAIHDALDALTAALAVPPSEELESSNIRFLVIAPANSLFPFSASTSQGHAILTTFMRQVASLARQHRLTVLVINNPVASQPTNLLSAFPATITKPGLGPTFTYLCDHTVWISSADDVFGEHDETLALLKQEGGDNRQVYIAETLRSRSLVSEHTCPTWPSFVGVIQT